MSLDLEPEAVTPADEYENVDGHEQIDGVWVEKHPDEPRPVENVKGYELLDDIWVEKPVSNLSGFVQGNVSFALGAYGRETGTGFLMGTDTAYKLDPARKKLRKPDASFVRADRFTTNRPTDKAFDFPPDLAVEVVSPTDMAADLDQKLDEYRRAGVPLTWVVYVPTRCVWAYKPDGTARRFGETDTLTGGDVLPGLAVRVSELFAGL